MKIRFLGTLPLIGTALFLASPILADQEEDLIATLCSSATAAEKCAACQKLSIHGTARSVPALEALLGTERVAHAARHALETIPCADAGTALRDALAKTSGPMRTGLVDSVGWRRDEKAVPLLEPFLRDEDETLASTAASALGRVASPEAVALLRGALDHPIEAVRWAVLEGLLDCAEQRLAQGRRRTAAKLYSDVFEAEAPSRLRAAGWRGRVLSRKRGRARLLLDAFRNEDPVLREAAFKLVRQLEDRRVFRACSKKWDSLPCSAQLAVLEGHLQWGPDALDTVLTAKDSEHLPVRAAAWLAMGEMGAPDLVPLLSRRATEGQEAERQACREALARIHGPRIREAILDRLRTAGAEEKAVLLLSLGERREADVTPLLLKYAQAGESQAPLAAAALAALRELADPETLSPLLDLYSSVPLDSDRDAVLKALFAVCDAYSDKEEAAGRVIGSLDKHPPGLKANILPLLAELGGPLALDELMKISRSKEVELAREAVKALSRWTAHEPARHLFELAKDHEDRVVKTLALRGAVTLAGYEPDLGRRMELLRGALDLAERTEEKRLALSQLGKTGEAEALPLILGHLKDASLKNEAGTAALDIAESLADSDPRRADEVARQVLEHCEAQAIANRAWALRSKPGAGGLVIKDWLVTAPYRKRGAFGALALFNIPFGPEKESEEVTWYAASVDHSVPLHGFFPGQEHCAAYLKAEIVSPRALEALLLMGSDDGIQAWLNGDVVHSNNVDRPQIVDQDMAKVELKQGVNELMLKITQGGGGWSACARIVGRDGLPIEGLRVKSQEGQAPSVGAYVPPKTVQAEPQDSQLPPLQEDYRTVCLSPEFYAEGASYGDFNRDGHLDVVAGPFWFEGPEFKKRREYRPSKAFDPKGYSDCFFCFTGDLNRDEWDDILCVPIPGDKAYWYANPKGKEQHWASHLVHSFVGNESPAWEDVTGDGRLELLFCVDGYLGYASPNTDQPTEPWEFHPISNKDPRFQRFTHGLGVGDINGDGLADIVESTGWWEQKEDTPPGQPWPFHPVRFAEAGAQMLVHDVDGDGLSDVITAWHCHHYGMLWWEQTETAEGKRDWQQHVIMSPVPDLSTTDFRVSQMHALDLVDMNGDGLMDILTGKRFWAHGPTGDKEPDAPAVVFWFELDRKDRDSVRFVPKLIHDDSGVGTQVTAADLNTDNRPDVIVANKKGIFLHLSD